MQKFPICLLCYCGCCLLLLLLVDCFDFFWCCHCTAALPLTCWCCCHHHPIKLIASFLELETVGTVTALCAEQPARVGVAAWLPWICRFASNGIVALVIVVILVVSMFWDKNKTQSTCSSGIHIAPYCNVPYCITPYCITPFHITHHQEVRVDGWWHNMGINDHKNENNLPARVFVTLGMQQLMLSLPGDSCFIFLLQHNAADAISALFFAEQCHCWSQLLLLLWLLKLIFCFCHHTALLYFSADGLPKQLLLSLLILWHSWPAKIATTVFYECSCHHPCIEPPPNFSCSHILVTIAVTACCPVLLSLALPCAVNNAAMVVAVLAASPLVDCWVLVWKPLCMRLL